MRISTTTLTAAALALALLAAVLVRATAPVGAVAALPGGAQATAHHPAPAPGGPEATLVRSSDVARAGLDTPAQALLAWWQLVQLDGPLAEIQAGFAPAAGVTRGSLERRLAPVRYLFLQTLPRPVETVIEGHRARVVVVLVRLERQPGGAVRERHVLETFPLVRVAGRWRLSDDAYLQGRYRAERDYARVGGP